MPTAENAKLQYEAGQTPVAMAALSDSGDHTVFEGSSAPWSRVNNYTPVIRPNGLVTGGVVSAAASGTNNYVDTTAGSAYIAGTLVTWSAASDSDCPRADATYLVLTLAASGYTNCVADDIGKTVTGGTTGDTGVLVAYNNTTRQWLIDQTDSGDVFDDDDEALTIGTGTGAGDLSAVGATPTYIIHSITATSGGSIAVVNGHEGTSYSTTRGDLGGPPLIPVTSVELAQVRYASATAAAVASTDLYSTVGTHTERWDYPIYDVDYYSGEVTFVSALPLIHTGGLPKGVYASFSTPVFADVQKSSNFVPPENNYSVSSTQIYGRTLGTSSASMRAGSFDAYFEDGINDGLVGLVGEVLWFKFYPDQYKSSYIMAQGKLGMNRRFPAGDAISASCTIAAEEVATNVSA